MPALSFVIPALNEEARIGAVLARLEERFPGAERIVVDGGSADATVQRALRGASAVLLGSPGRAAQMNLGAAAAGGDYLCFLHADSCPEFDAPGLLAALRGAEWGYCRIRLRGATPALRVISLFMNLRSRLTGIATGDQMIVVSRAFFAAQGGFAPIPLMEDVELCRRLRRQASPRVIPLTVSSSGRRWERDGVVSTVVLMWALRLAFWLGVSPQRLWRRYYGGGALAPQAEQGR